MPDDPVTPPAAGKVTPTTAAEVRYIDADVERIAGRYGGKDAAIKALFREAKKARDGRRTAEEEVATLKEAAKPKAGTLTLTGDDAKAWEKFKAIGKPIDDVVKMLGEHADLAAKNQTNERKTSLAKIAGPLKWNADVLLDLVETRGLNIVTKTEKVDGKDVEVAYHQPKETGAAAVKLTDHISNDAKLKLYMPALMNGAGGATGAPSGTPYFEQSASGGKTTDPEKKQAPGAPVVGVQPRVLPSQRNAKKP